MQKLEIDLKISIIFLLFIAAIHIAALLALLNLAIAWYLQLTLFVIVIGSFAYTIHRYIFFKTPKTIQHAICLDGDEWHINDNGSYHPAILEPQGYLSNWLIILNFRTTKQNKSIRVNMLIFPDSLDQEAQRQLRCILKFGS